MSEFQAGVDFEVITPGCCNAPFGMQMAHYRQRLNDKKSWWCPSCGCNRHFTGKTEEEKLKDKLKEAQRTIDSNRRALEEQSGKAAVAISQLNEVKKASLKMRQRIKNGVCPCCNRTFQNFMEHMKHQHPDFGKAETFKGMRDLFGLSQTSIAREIGVQASYISQYERDKYVPEHAKKVIENWIESQA